MYQLYLASPNAAASAAQHPPCLPWLPAAASHPLLTNPEHAWQGSSLQQLWRQQWLVHQYALLTPGRERGRESRKKGDKAFCLPPSTPLLITHPRAISPCSNPPNTSGSPGLSQLVTWPGPEAKRLLQAGKPQWKNNRPRRQVDLGSSPRSIRNWQCNLEHVPFIFLEPQFPHL